MLRPVLILLVLAVLAGGGFFLYQNLKIRPASQPTPIPQITKTPSTTQITSTTSPQATLTLCQVLEQGSTDVPPLYKEGIIWEKPVIDEYEVPLLEGAKKLKGCLIKSSELQFSNASQVRSWYTSEMLNRQWVSVASSDLPGEASPDTWTKNNKKLLFEIVPFNKPNTQIVLFYSQ